VVEEETEGCGGSGGRIESSDTMLILMKGMKDIYY